MSRQSRTQPAASSGGAVRQNEYFVPRDGIDREVISADICRYLGNDALVRPGVYENPQTGQVAQGYFITAYRNLTTVRSSCRPCGVRLLSIAQRSRPNTSRRYVHVLTADAGNDRRSESRLGSLGQRKTGADLAQLLWR
jgi:hypothetical protein